MSTELEDRLRTDMEQFTRDIHVPRGLALKADRHRRKRRVTLRVAMAAGAAAALAIGAVAAAGATGAFGSAPPTAPAETTAYVLRQVESALAPANVDNLISVNRIVFPPGMTLEPTAGGGLKGGPATGSAGSPWRVAYLVHWAYRGSQKYSAYGPNGQHVFDIAVSAANGSATETAVIYADRTWWTTFAAAGPSSAGCFTNSIRLNDGVGNGWPAFIRSQLACGAYTVAGHELIGGTDAIKITGSNGQLTLLVNPATYLPIEFSIGPERNYFRWLRPTRANLAQLKEAVPAGFRQVPPPQP